MNCANCRYFQPSNPKAGECRNEPPKMFMVPIEGRPEMIAGKLQAGQMAMAPMAFFPVLPNDAWCGKHSPVPMVN